MTTNNERSKIRRQKLKEQNIEDRNEKRRLKALPKPLRQLETELSAHVGFMAVYDGYLGDFTGEIIPVEPVKNPFEVIHNMGLNFPHPHSLNDLQKEEYLRAIKNAFNRLGFDFNYPTIFEIKNPVKYEQLHFFIENPPKVDFGHLTTLKTDDKIIAIEKLEFDINN